MEEQASRSSHLVQPTWTLTEKGGKGLTGNALKGAKKKDEIGWQEDDKTQDRLLAAQVDADNWPPSFPLPEHSVGYPACKTRKGIFSSNMLSCCAGQVAPIDVLGSMRFRSVG